MRAGAIALALLLGCGRIGFDPIAGSGDAGTSGVQQAYIKASNTGAGELFAASVALSADGATLGVGALYEDSAATGIDGDQLDSSAPRAGAAYVFTRSGGAWAQAAYVKASNTEGDDEFGGALALAGDGTRLAVGATLEASAATGIDGNQGDNSAASAGAVYVFARAGTTWSQEAYVKGPSTAANALFGSSVALSGDGATLAVGADGQSLATGAVHVFTRSGSTWSVQATLVASNPETGDGFGYSVALSRDGSTLAVGATSEASAATGIDGNQADNSVQGSGAVYVFTRSGTTWTQQAYVKASNPGVFDTFGFSLALSDDGSTLVVGADGESSAATGVDGNQSDDSAVHSGAAYVFTRAGATWAQQAYIKASNTDANDHFGVSIALAGDGSLLLVGANQEASRAIGVGGDQGDNSTPLAGAFYLYRRTGTAWTQSAYVKASNTDVGDAFGYSAALSADGTTAAAGAIAESSAATGIGGDQADNSAVSAGAVYVFR